MKAKVRRSWHEALRHTCRRSVSPVAGIVVVCMMIGLALAIYVVLVP